MWTRARLRMKRGCCWWWTVMWCISKFLFYFFYFFGSWPTDFCCKQQCTRNDMYLCIFQQWNGNNSLIDNILSASQWKLLTLQGYMLNLQRIKERFRIHFWHKHAHIRREKKHFHRIEFSLIFYAIDKFLLRIFFFDLAHVFSTNMEKKNTFIYKYKYNMARKKNDLHICTLF